METVRIHDPGWKKVGSGIRDKHPGSATLPFIGKNLYILGNFELESGQIRPKNLEKQSYLSPVQHGQ
jgi:hypothetical protein